MIPQNIRIDNEDFISLFKRLKPPSLRRTDLSPMARDDIMFEKRGILWSIDMVATQYIK